MWLKLLYWTPHCGFPSYANYPIWNQCPELRSLWRVCPWIGTTFQANYGCEWNEAGWLCILSKLNKQVQLNTYCGVGYFPSQLLMWMEWRRWVGTTFQAIYKFKWREYPSCKYCQSKLQIRMNDASGIGPSTAGCTYFKYHLQIWLECSRWVGTTLQVIYRRECYIVGFMWLLFMPPTDVIGMYPVGCRYVSSHPQIWSEFCWWQRD